MQRKGPLRGKIFARCIPERRFAGLFGYMARISCHRQLISDTWRRYVAMNWRFSRPRLLFGYMARKTCHGLPPGNAWHAYLATVGCSGTHRACILPSARTRLSPRRRNAERCRRAGRVGLRAMAYPPIALHPPPTVPPLPPLRGAGAVACWFCAASTAIVQRLNRLRLLPPVVRGFGLVDDP